MAHHEEVADLMAENARLKGLIDRLVDVVAGSRSGYVAGSQYDIEWDQAKNAALADVRAALTK